MWGVRGKFLLTQQNWWVHAERCDSSRSTSCTTALDGQCENKVIITNAQRAKQRWQRWMVVTVYVVVVSKGHYFYTWRMRTNKFYQILLGWPSIRTAVHPITIRFMKTSSLFIKSNSTETMLTVLVRCIVDYVRELSKLHGNISFWIINRYEYSGGMVVVCIVQTHLYRVSQYGRESLYIRIQSTSNNDTAFMQRRVTEVLYTCSIISNALLLPETVWDRIQCEIDFNSKNIFSSLNTFLLIVPSIQLNWMHLHWIPNCS